MMISSVIDTSIRKEKYVYVLISNGNGREYFKQKS
jgi:hypothetical protein